MAVLAGAASTAHAGVNCLQAQWTPETNTLTVRGAGTCRLALLKRPGVPIHLTDPAAHVWDVGCRIVLRDGARLELFGTSLGGDVDLLRLQSNNDGGRASVASISAQWGSIDIRGTRITSWDTAVGGPDTDVVTGGRAFIRARSYVDADGVTLRESRMDIVDSEIAYLGWDHAESYGLSWKVWEEDPALRGRLRVRGDVTRARIHDNFRGLYASGTAGARWSGNTVTHNLDRGMELHEDVDGATLQANRVEDNGDHGMVLASGVRGATLQSNTVSHNAGSGLVLASPNQDNLVRDNTLTQNAAVGILVQDGQRNELRGNHVERNRVGIRLSGNTQDTLVADNTLSANADYGVDLQPDATPGAGGSGRPQRTTLLENHVEYHPGPWLRITNADTTVAAGNGLLGNAPPGVLVTDAAGTVLDGNPADGALELRCRVQQEPTEVLVRNQEDIQVQLDPDAQVVVADGDGRLHRAADRVPTQVTRTGATLSLTRGNTRGSALLQATNVWVSVDRGHAQVTTLEDGRRARWALKGSDPLQVVEARLSGLTPEGWYVLTRDGHPPWPLRADALGRLHFKDLLGTTDRVVYQVAEPGPGGCAAAPEAPSGLGILLVLLALLTARSRTGSPPA